MSSTLGCGVGESDEELDEEADEVDVDVDGLVVLGEARRCCCCCCCCCLTSSRISLRLFTFFKVGKKMISKKAFHINK